MPRGNVLRFAPFENAHLVPRRHTIDLTLAPTARRLTISTDDERIDRYVRTTYARLLKSHRNDDTADRAELLTVRPARARFEDTLLPAPDASDPERPWNSGSYTTDQFIWKSLAKDERWVSLHGSALCIGGRGVLLVGPSGCGKTTLSLALAATGAGWYGDIEERTGAGASGVVARERHRLAFADALGALDALSPDLPVEIVAEHLRATRFALERLIGIVDVEDILGDVFSRFCIGK